MASASETAAMRRALELAARGPAVGPQPPGRLRDPRRRRGTSSPRAGTGARARRTPRSTPCAAGRRRGAAAAPPSSPSSRATTPAAPVPCTQALIDAGVARVVDRLPPIPNPVAAGGRRGLRGGRGRRRGRRPRRRARRAQPPLDCSPSRTAVPSSPGSSRPPSTAAAPPPTARAAGSPVRRARADVHARRATVGRDPRRHRHRPRRRPPADGPRRRRPCDRAAAAARRRRPTDRAAGRPGPATTRRRPCACRTRTRPRSSPSCTPARSAHVWLEGGPTARRRVPAGPGWSTRSSPTSPPPCSARARPPSATSGSPLSTGRNAWSPPTCDGSGTTSSSSPPPGTARPHRANRIGRHVRSAMFTGIVEELGEVVCLEAGAASARITVRGPLRDGRRRPRAPHRRQRRLPDRGRPPATGHLHRRRHARDPPADLAGRP